MFEVRYINGRRTLVPAAQSPMILHTLRKEGRRATMTLANGMRVSMRGVR